MTPVAGPADVARRATATDAAPRIIFVICVLAIAARLILVNEPYVDHWSWRQSDVAAIARIFLQTDFVSAIRKFDPTSAQVAPANAAAIGANGI